MVLNTTNRSTISTAVNVRASIINLFETIKLLINDNTNTGIILIRKIKEKLSRIDHAIEVFRKDNMKNLNDSDKLALDLLKTEVMNFIISVDQKNKKELLKETEHLLITANLTLATG